MFWKKKPPPIKLTRHQEYLLALEEYNRRNRGWRHPKVLHRILMGCFVVLFGCVLILFYYTPPEIKETEKEYLRLLKLKEQKLQQKK
jgi:hypothetical protein